LPSAVNHRRRKSQVETVTPTSHDLTRFTERCRARDLGYELPIDTREAADYVGFHPKTVERMARMGEIPAHPVSGVSRKTWKFYPSELDVRLRAKVCGSLLMKSKRDANSKVVSMALRPDPQQAKVA
jgi:excisionase family DNA binding protein